MTEYQSAYTGAEIDAGIGKANTAAQPADLNGKQNTLVSGENIKTINNESLLGSGNIEVGNPSQEQIAEAVDAWLDDHPEATTTVEDGSITVAKLASDVTGLFNNIDAEINGGEVEKTKTSTGNPVTLTSGTDISATIAVTDPNLLNNTKAVGTTTPNGLTVTVNSDKSVTIDGTASTETDITLFDDTFTKTITSGYFLTGCPQGGAADKYMLRCVYKPSSWVERYDYGSGVEIPTSITGNSVKFQIRVKGGVTLDNATFYPMLAKRKTDYTPYYNGYKSSKKVTIDGTEHNVNNAGEVQGEIADNSASFSSTKDVTITVSYKDTEEVNGVVNDILDIQEDITEINGDISDINAEIEELKNPSVQDYFETELATTVNTIRGICNNGRCIVLSIVTDSHTDLTSTEAKRRWKETIENIKAVNKEITSDAVIHLGDILGSAQANYPTWDSVNSHLFKAVNELKECNPHTIVIPGNHDGINSLYPDERKTYNAMYSFNRDYVVRENSAYKKSTDTTVSASKTYYTRTTSGSSYVYTAVAEPTGNPSTSDYYEVNKSGRPYCYSDFKDLKVRLIFLASSTYYEAADTGTDLYGKEQVLWFRDVLNATPDGWKVIVFSHINPFDSDVNESERYGLYHDSMSLVGMLNAFHNHTTFTKQYYGGISVDFTSRATTQAIAWVSGHGHYDRVIKDTTKICCPAVFICRERINGNDDLPSGATQPSRTDKTVTQDLWDTLCYDTDNNVLSFIRFGAGDDRLDLLAEE